MDRIPIKILFEDNYIIVIEKREGLLSVGTSKGREELTAHRLLNNYLRNTCGKSGGKRGRNTDGRWSESQPRAYIVHRLDRETSGLMVFAKSEEIKLRMQENWDQVVTERKYVAVANGAFPIEEGVEPTGTFRSWLKENSAFIVYSSPKENGGQLAITHYRVLESSAKRHKTLFELNLATGRKNQIRVHLQEMGYPVFGDKKYFGNNPSILAENKKAHRLYLHAYKLSFIHPVTGKQMKFTTGIPRSFKEVL